MGGEVIRQLVDVVAMITDKATSVAVGRGHLVLALVTLGLTKSIDGVPDIKKVGNMKGRLKAQDSSLGQGDVVTTVRALHGAALVSLAFQ